MFFYTIHEGKNKLVNHLNELALSDYDDDLLYNEYDPYYVGVDPNHGRDCNYDIIEVYNVNLSHGFSYLFDSDHLTLVWKRKEFIEITMQEIADKFNIPIEQLRIKDKESCSVQAVNLLFE